MILAAGELLAEFVSHQLDCGLSQTAMYSGPYASGAPAIFIDQASRVGAETRLFGCVGQDPFGRMLIEKLRHDGVGIDDIRVIPDKTTGTAFVSYYSNGERTFLFHLRGTASEVMSNGVAPTTPFTLHISGASLTIAEPRDAILHLARSAVKSGGKVSCDPNVRPELLADSDAFKALDTILALSRIVLPSESDLKHLYPEVSTEAACHSLIEKGADTVVLKRGCNGITIFDQTGQVSIPAYKVSEVDPTGAGDCFCGAFLGLLDQEYPLLVAAKLANAAGAIHVTKRGPMEGNPTLPEIRSFIERSEAVASY